ncbi:MAG: hypothetical protein V2I33_10325 [Kangiellaceae bacterium]|jgi:hypothetical protein|nr:hypothetical protein [Kangiellaceae bacterium]
MTGRTVPLSVRVTHEDADFIASIDIEGAESPSEKLRALIAEARRRHNAEGGFAESQLELRKIIQPLTERVQDFEAEQDMYSQLLHLGLEWIPEAMAELVAQRLQLSKATDKEQMIKLERRVTDRVFRLIEGFLRLAITKDCEGYDPEVVRKKLPRINQLFELIRLMEGQTEV